MQLKTDAEKYNLHIPQTILYQTHDTIGIRLGFAHLTFDEIDEIISILKKCVSKQLTFTE